MSYTLIDFFLGFQSVQAKSRFSASVQSMYFAILAKFNSAHYPATLPISTRDLAEEAGLKSVATAHTCKNILKNNKLIDFKTTKGTTVYRLLTEHLPNKNPTLAEHLPNAKRTAGGLFNSPAHVEVKTRERDDDAGAHEGDGVQTTKPESLDTGALPLSSPVSPISQDANAIHEEWVKAFGFELQSGWALELERLASLDYARTVTAIQRTKASNPANPFPYFKRVWGNSPQEEKPKVKEKTVQDMFSSLTQLENNIGGNRNDDE